METGGVWMTGVAAGGIGVVVTGGATGAAGGVVFAGGGATRGRRGLFGRGLGGAVAGDLRGAVFGAGGAARAPGTIAAVVVVEFGAGALELCGAVFGGARPCVARFAAAFAFAARGAVVCASAAVITNGPTRSVWVQPPSLPWERRMNHQRPGPSGALVYCVPLTFSRAGGSNPLSRLNATE